MDYIQDESLQGFIFRRLLLWGESSSYHGLISDDGCWFKAPFLPKEIFYVFDDVPDDFLITKLFQAGLIKIQFDSFFYPYDWLYGALNKTFYGKKIFGRSPLKVPIRFCAKCVGEDIAEVGFGYLHRDWIVGSFCEKHLTPLLQVKGRKRQNVITNLKNILRGNSVGDVVDVDVHSIAYSDPTVRKGIVFPVKPTLCSLNDFGGFIRENAFELECLDLGYSEVDWLSIAGSFQFAYKMGSKYAFYDLQVDSVALCYSDHISMLYEFLYENMRLIRQPIGSRRQLYDMIMVPNNFSCEKCPNAYACLVSQDIYHEPEDTDNSQDFVMESSSLLKLMRNQNYELNFQNSLPWSPVEFSIK